MVVNCGKLAPTFDDLARQILTHQSMRVSVDNVVEKLPEQQRGNMARLQLSSLMEGYAGLSYHAECILTAAIGAQQFEEYFQKLEDHLRDRLSHFSPNQVDLDFLRKPAGYTTKKFLSDCYNGLHIPCTL